jgi:hypothetical protein
MFARSLMMGDEDVPGSLGEGRVDGASAIRRMTIRQNHTAAGIRPARSVSSRQVPPISRRTG